MDKIKRLIGDKDIANLLIASKWYQSPYGVWVNDDYAHVRVLCNYNNSIDICIDHIHGGNKYNVRGVNVFNKPRLTADVEQAIRDSNFEPDSKDDVSDIIKDIDLVCDQPKAKIVRQSSISNWEMRSIAAVLKAQIKEYVI